VKLYDASSHACLAEFFADGGVAVTNSTKQGENMVVAIKNGYVYFLNMENPML
jgi:hypothetical protein